MGLDAFIWVLFVGCLVLSFLLSGMEAGVFALSRVRVRQQMRAGRASAQLLHRYLEHPEHFLWTILVGNTVANFFILGWMLAVLVRALPGRWALVVAFYLAGFFLFYALFDLLPKLLFRRFPNRLCMALAGPFRLVHLMLVPLVAVVEGVSRTLLRLRGGHVFTGRVFGNREELRMVMQESGPALSSEEKQMINRVLDLQSHTVRQVMTPLSQAVTLPVGSTVADALRVARERSLNRIPVVETRDGQQRFSGLIAVSKLLYAAVPPESPAAPHIQPGLYLEEDARLEVALRRMQRSGQPLAIVLGPDHREAGLLSLQDILNLLFGKVSL